MSGGWLDGDFYGHPKVLHAWALCRASIGMWSLAVSYAHKHNTRGLVSAVFVNEKLPNKREREAVIAALTTIAPGESNPLWHPTDGGWLIHNFGEIESRSFSDPTKAERTRRWREGRGATGQDGDVTSDVTPRHSDVQGDTRDKEREVLQALIGRDDLLSLCDRLGDAMLANDPKAKVAPRSFGWLDAARLLLDRDGRTVKEVEEVIDWCQADDFWHTNILSMSKLRKKFGELSLKMRKEAVTPIRAADQRSGRRESPSELLQALEGAA